MFVCKFRVVVGAVYGLSGGAIDEVIRGCVNLCIQVPFGVDSDCGCCICSIRCRLGTVKL